MIISFQTIIYRVQDSVKNWTQIKMALGIYWGCIGNK